MSTEHLQTEESRSAQWKSASRTHVKGLGFTMRIDRAGSDERRPYVCCHFRNAEGEYRQLCYSVSKYGGYDATRAAAECLVAEKFGTDDPLIEIDDPGNELNNEHTTDPDRIFDIAWPHMMFLIYQAGFVELTYQGER